MFQITSKAGTKMGTYAGNTAEESYHAMCRDIRCECEKRQIEYGPEAVGTMEDFEFVQAA